MTRVLLVDDHRLVREGLRRILAEHDASVEVDEASDADQTLALLAAAPYQVVVLDIGLPDTDGIELLKRIHQTYPDTRVLMLTMYSEEQYAARALRAGAYGYLTKDRAAEELVAAVHRIAAGQRYITESVGERLADEMARGEDRPAHELLSDRELQVLREIARGKTVTEIAAALEISVKTVSTYRTRILQKTSLTRNAELVRYALAHGLVQ